MTRRTLAFDSTRSRTVRALLTASLLSWVLAACAAERTDAVTCCKPGITYGNRGGGTTFLVLTIDGSGQHAIFDLQP